MVTELQRYKLKLAESKASKEQKGLVKAETSKIKAQTSYLKESRKGEKLGGFIPKGVTKLASGRASYREGKEKRATIHISNREVENIFDEDNRFFKGNFEKEKRSMFLS